MSKQNVLKEAIADAQALKKAFEANAERVLREHFKKDIKSFVESQLNEEELGENMAGGQDTHDMDFPYEGVDDQELREGTDMADTDEDFELDFDEDSDEGFDEDDDEDGLSEDELAEALMSVISEVEHPSLDEMEFVDPDKRADSRGLKDDDKKEDGWEQKTPPKATGTQVYGGGKYHESKKLVALAKEAALLKKENKQLKRANSVLKESIEEMKVFNLKLMKTHKLLEAAGSQKGLRTKIVEAMDKAQTAKEVTSIFETWKSALSVMGGTSKKTPLSEALGSIKESRGADPQAQDGQLNESKEFARWRQLAGLND